MAEIVTRWPDGDGEMAARIRAFAWSGTPLGPAAAWSERLKVMVEQVLASPLVASLVCGPERVLIYNDVAAKLYGDRHPAALGRPLPASFPEGWATVAPLYERAFAGETVAVTGQPLDTSGAGEATDVFDALLTPVRAADGHVAFVHMTGSEIGARARAEIVLRDSETRHRLLIESWAQAVWETDAAGIVVTDSPSWRTYTGQTLDEWLGYGWLDPIHPGDRAYAERQWREAVATRALVDAEFRLRAPGGGWRWTNVRAAPVLDDAGNIEKWAGINIDIDTRKRAETTLQESEERQAFLLKLSDALRPLGDPVEVQGEAARLLGEHLDAGGCNYVEVDAEAGDWVIRRDYRRDGLSSIAGRFRREEWPLFGEDFLRGEPMSIPNIAQYSLISPEERTVTEALGLVAIIIAPITKGGRFLGGLAVTDSKPRAWTPDDMALLVEVAERTWAAVERARAETALRESEKKYRRLFETITDGFGICELVRDEAGRATDWRFLELNPALAQHTGMDPAASVGPLFSQLFPSADRSYWLGVYQTVVDTQTPQAFEAYWPPIDRWLAGEASPVGGEQFYIVYRDVTERKRAELALRQSEERFRQFAQASASGLWIRDAETLAMEYVSPAVSTIYGVEMETFLGDVQRWAALIVPEDRDTALKHIEQACHGEVVVHEFRIQRLSDGTFRWIRNTDFPLLGHDGAVERIGGIAEDVTEAKLTAEHSAVLLAELQHRVRNIMAVIRAITARTGERAETVPDYAEAMAGRLMTLARVQALLTRSANAGVGIAGIVRDELGAKAEHAGQYTLDGPDLVLSPKAAEVLTLAVHELTTNALKYGGLSVPDGRVAVRWATFEKRGTSWLGFDWIEAGAPERPPPDPSVPRRRGFGSELIEGRIPYELGGSGSVDIEPGGARCRLEFPLRDGDSILETDAPHRATVFGGALDMTGVADLSGRRVLVIEDDFYLATDAARALQAAGADVVGPCPNEEIARDRLEEQRPDAAVLDINLGRGPSFVMAEALRDRGIPFVFTTGYDLEVIPAKFDSVQRLQKPVQLRQIVTAVAQLLSGA